MYRLAEDEQLLELEQSGRTEVVGVCDDYESLCATIEQTRPDVVVTDIRMPPTGTNEGIRLAAELSRRGRFDLRETAGGTEVTFTLDVKPRGLMVLMTSMINKQVHTEVGNIANLPKAMSS